MSKRVSVVICGGCPCRRASAWRRERVLEWRSGSWGRAWMSSWVCLPRMRHPRKGTESSEVNMQEG